MSFRVGGEAAPRVGIVVEDILAAVGRPGAVGMVDRPVVAAQVRVGVRRQAGGVGSKRAVAAVAVVAAVGSLAAAEVEVETGSENENENVGESAAAGVGGGARNEASKRPLLRLEVGKKSSSRRPGQLGSGQRQSGQNMNKIESDFGRRPGCGTS